MFRPLELFIGLRYTRAKRRNHFISFISLISIGGVALGITVMITVLSVMNGFQTEVRSRILDMTAHVTITGPGGKLADWPTLGAQLAPAAEIVDSAPYVEGQAMLVQGGEVSGALLRGILPGEEARVADIGAHMVAGSLASLEPGAYNIVLGSELAEILGVLPGDKVTVITPQATVSPAGILPRLRRFTVTGIFKVGMAQYDRATALLHLDDAARLLQLGDAVSGLRLELTDALRAPWVTRQLTRALGPEYWVSDWTQMHANFFRAVRMEKTIMFTLMVLIVAVAAFNIVSTLMMTVTDKQADIAILRTLGTSARRVMAIFVIQGTIIGLIGMILGVIGGTALAFNLEAIVATIEQVFHTQFLSPDVYYISELPSDPHLSDILRIAGAAFALTVLATLYPAWRASRTAPAEALRYE